MKASGLRTFVFVTGALMVGAIAQAQQPSQASKTTTAAASTPAASQPTAKSAADSKAADPSATLLRDAANAGFKPEHIRGSLMFCRTATELGSNFPVRTCYNEEQVKIKIEEYRTERNQLEGMHSNGLKGN